MPTISFTLWLPPIGKPRMTRRDRWAKRPVVMKYRHWCDELRRVAGEVPDAETISEIRLMAAMPMPPSWSGRKRDVHRGQRHRSRPDADNISKAVLDALWEQDSGIADLVCRKRWQDDGHLTVEIDYDDQP